METDSLVEEETAVMPVWAPLSWVAPGEKEGNGPKPGGRAGSDSWLCIIVGTHWLPNIAGKNKFGKLVIQVGFLFFQD